MGVRVMLKSSGKFPEDVGKGLELETSIWSINAIYRSLVFS